MIGTNDGAPLIVGADGYFWPLEQLPISVGGKGTYDEAWLQRLIHQAPACLPIAEIEPRLDTFHAVCFELPIPRGFVDNLLMTGRGDIAIVEAKLFRNPEARRQAIAQALDYATAIFELGYSDFEKAVLRANYGASNKPESLYEALPEAEKLPEAQFVDAVSRNLRQGRAIVLVVGDGIRSEAEALLDGVQAHARFGFTLGLVELGLFRMPEADQRILVRPRVVARTVITQRTIVEVIDGGLALTVKDERLPAAQTLSSADYWDILETKVPGARRALERLIQATEPFGVYPDFLKSLNLKWDSPGGKTVNLGYIYLYSSIWTDVTSSGAPKELARAYVQDLAATWGCDVHELPKGGAWTLYKAGKPLRLAEVLDHLEEWTGPVQRLIAALSHDT